MILEDRQVVLREGEGLEIPPEVPHRFLNRSDGDVHFLVISVPSTRGDRVELP